MTERTPYRLGPDVADDEALYDSHGRLIDDRYAEEAAVAALQHAHGVDVIKEADPRLTPEQNREQRHSDDAG